jgi:polyhydroxybutyrate depolymerase
MALSRFWAAVIVSLSFTAFAFGEDASPAKPSHGAGGKVGVFKTEKIEVGDDERSFRLVAPKTIDAQTPAPLVFAFHGLGDSSGLMSWYTQLDRVAEKHKFVLIYPNAQSRLWPLSPRMAKRNLDFFDALYKFATENYNIDQRRVYVIGMSNGGFFSHLLARERPDKIAAIAPHSAGLGLMTRDPKLTQKYAVILIHGDKDGIVKVEESRKAHEAYTKWGHDVEYLEVKGLNHFWAHKADVTEKIWAFFAAHPLSVEAKATGE